MAKFCQKCGTELKKDSAFCSNCGSKVGSEEKVATTNTNEPASKSKILAGILGILFGCYGVHNFYLGYTGKAVAQLVLTIIGMLTSWLFIGIVPIFAVWIWSLIEGILILTGNIDTDANGVKLSN